MGMQRDFGADAGLPLFQTADIPLSGDWIAFVPYAGADGRAGQRPFIGQIREAIRRGGRVGYAVSVPTAGYEAEPAEVIAWLDFGAVRRLDAMLGLTARQMHEAARLANRRAMDRRPATKPLRIWVRGGSEAAIEFEGQTGHRLLDADGRLSEAAYAPSAGSLALDGWRAALNLHDDFLRPARASGAAIAVAVAAVRASGAPIEEGEETADAADEPSDLVQIFAR